MYTVLNVSLSMADVTSSSCENGNGCVRCVELRAKIKRLTALKQELSVMKQELSVANLELEVRRLQADAIDFCAGSGSDG